MPELCVPVSFGELLDKIAILQIKSERIMDAAKRNNVQRELVALDRIWMASPVNDPEICPLRAQLKAVNERLWEIEDRIREKERDQVFDDAFIALARQVYLQNDERAQIKRQINLRLGSSLIEEKSYAPYQRPSGDLA